MKILYHLGVFEKNIKMGRSDEELLFQKEGMQLLKQFAYLLSNMVSHQDR